MTTAEFLTLQGDFTWLLTSEFFIETAVGNFIWNSPAYLGDNSIHYTTMTFEEYLEDRSLSYGRYKGHHVIGTYLGTEVIFTRPTMATLARFAL